MFLKICGLTTPQDAAHAASTGATALGVIFAPSSPRYVTPDRARDIVEAVPTDIPVVGVFVDATLDDIVATVAYTGIRIVQLHGGESESLAAALKMPVIKAVGADASPNAWVSATLLVDAMSGVQRGGTGVRVDWQKAASLARQRKVVLAGGLTADNVAEAIGVVQPHGVDVSSGVETSPGRKDRDKVARFLANARAAYVAAGL
jgi:phosphoribosylanthranilate isomerase